MADLLRREEKARREKLGYDHKDDDLSVLYDVLFDDETVCGLKLFTETRRIYRLTKQAFLNVSHSSRPKSQRAAGSARSQQATGAQLPTDWRKRDGPSNNNEPVPPKSAQLQNWRKGQSDSLQNQVNNNTNTTNTVSEFFSAYRKPGSNVKLVSPRKPEEPWRQQQQQQGTRSAKSVDAEFQAMWGQLQQKLPMAPAPSQSHPAPLANNSPLNEQTNALKKFLRINDGGTASLPQLRPQPPVMSSTPHGFSGYLNPFQRVDNTTLAPEGRLFVQTPPLHAVFPPPNSQPVVERKEPAKELISGLVGMSNGPPGLPIPVARVPFPQSFNRHPLGGGLVRGHSGVVVPNQHLQQVRPTGGFYSLPSPPQQWYRAEMKPTAQLQPDQSSASRANPQVPSQASSAPATANNARPPNKLTEQLTAPQEPAAPQRRRARIAAKFNSQISK